MIDVEKLKEEIKTEILAELNATTKSNKQPVAAKNSTNKWIRQPNAKLSSMVGTLDAWKIYEKVRQIVRIIYDKPSHAGLCEVDQGTLEEVFDNLFGTVVECGKRVRKE